MATIIRILSISSTERLNLNMLALPKARGWDKVPIASPPQRQAGLCHTPAYPSTKHKMYRHQKRNFNLFVEGLWTCARVAHRSDDLQTKNFPPDARRSDST